MAFPWISAVLLGLTLGLASIAAKPREVNLPRWPYQVRYSGGAGVLLSLVFLAIFVAKVAWWSPFPVLASGGLLWLTARVMPRMARLALETIAILTWPFGLAFTAEGMRLFTGG